MSRSKSQQRMAGVTMIALFLMACSVPATPPAPTIVFAAATPPTATAVPPTPTAVPPTAALRPRPTETLVCTNFTASAILSASSTMPRVGQVITATLTVANKGCGSLGLPQYRLYVRRSEPQPIFDLQDPEPVVHYLGIASGQTDAERFVLRAIRPGRVTLNGFVSFEFHFGYPGPATWTGVGAEPLVITVEP